LHAAINTGVVALVALLISKGADVNQNMVYTYRSNYYVMSCLELALEKGEEGEGGAIIEALRSAGAQEAVEYDKGRGKGKYFHRSCDWDKHVRLYRKGGEGKWNKMAAAIEAKRKAKKVKGKGKGKKGKGKK